LPDAVPAEFPLFGLDQPRSLELIYAVLGYLGYLMNVHGLLAPRKKGTRARARRYG
jgi:hypothetical protein